MDLRPFAPNTKGRSTRFADTTDFTRAADAVELLLATVAPDQWAAPTPCAQWDLAQLTEHLIDVNFGFATQLAGAPGTIHVNDAPAHAAVRRYRTSTTQLRDALVAVERDGAGLSAQLRGRLALRVADLLIHGWDIATATGQPAHMPDDLTREALRFTRRRAGALRRSGKFAEPQPVDGHAPALDQLAALSGRETPQTGSPSNRPRTTTRLSQ
jgi:uncharacterized protein (TIGR03086 family)